METKQFIALLKNPKELSSVSFDTLNALSQQYPFVALFHTLLAKKAYEEKPHEYDRYLTKAAMQALDRTKLYYIIHQTKNKKKHEVEWVEEDIVATAENILADNNISEVSGITQTETVEINTDTTQISEEPTPIISETFIDSEKEEKTVFIKKEVAAISVEESVSEEKERKKEKKKKRHKKKTKEDLISPHTQLTFFDWLKLVSKKRNIQPEVAEEAENEDEDDNEQLEQEYHAGTFEAELQNEASTEPKSSTIPKMPEKWKKTSNEKAEIKISDLAQKSIQRDDNTITETLAKILELQKHYDKAIEAYEKLSLKYPEKSSYFATRILELKKKL